MRVDKDALARQASRQSALRWERGERRPGPEEGEGEGGDADHHGALTRAIESGCPNRGGPSSTSLDGLTAVAPTHHCQASRRLTGTRTEHVTGDHAWGPRDNVCGP